MTCKEDDDIEDDNIEDDGIKRMKKLVHVFNGSCVIGFNGTDCKLTIPICCFLLRLTAMNIDR